MFSLLTLGAADHEFDPRSGQTKDYKIDICCFSADIIQEKEQVLVGSDQIYHICIEKQTEYM
jgi:hypothetical protein